jgi:hypothetical protein
MTQTLWITISFALMLAAVAVLTHDLAQELQHRRACAVQAAPSLTESEPLKYRTAAAFATLAWIPVMLGLALMFSAS